MRHYGGKFSFIPCFASFFFRKTRVAIRSLASARSLPKSCQKRYCSIRGHQRARKSALERDESCPEHGYYGRYAGDIVVTHNLLRSRRLSRSAKEGIT